MRRFGPLRQEESNEVPAAGIGLCGGHDPAGELKIPPDPSRALGRASAPLPCSRLLSFMLNVVGHPTSVPPSRRPEKTDSDADLGGVHPLRLLPRPRHTRVMSPSREGMPRPHATRGGKRTVIVSEVLDDGVLVETLYDSQARSTKLAVAREGSISVADEVRTPDGRRLVPLPATNNLLVHSAVLLPSDVGEPSTKVELLASISAFLQRYVDLDPLFEQIAAHYVLLSWFYDRFSDLPYLRVLGEPGSGKTRFLLAIGSLCYKPIFASGASTVAPIFRMLDLVRGTLLVDEADFRFSDERAEVVKILNCGISRGFPVLRTDPNPTTKEFDPKAFHVFGPKIVGSRQTFEDRALETRFITESLGSRTLRSDVPIALPSEFASEARAIRNRLLRFRLDNWHQVRAAEAVGLAVEPRLRQMFGPLMTLVDDPIVRTEIADLASTYHSQLQTDRGLAVEGTLLEALRELWDPKQPPSLQDLARVLTKKGTLRGPDPISPRWVGTALRQRLGIRTERHRDGYRVAGGQERQVSGLFVRFGTLS